MPNLLDKENALKETSYCYDVLRVDGVTFFTNSEAAPINKVI